MTVVVGGAVTGSTLNPDRALAWLRQHFPELRHRHGDEYLINNPFDDDAGLNLSVNPARGVCHDWRGDGRWAGQRNPRTGKHNCSLLNFARLYLRCSFLEAARVLGATVVRPEAAAAPPAGAGAAALPEGTRRFDGSRGAEVVRAWLRRRGVDDAEIALRDVRWRQGEVVWPYFEYDELVYWQSRMCFSKVYSFPPKAEGDPGKGDFLYGFDLLEPAAYLILVEAIFGVHTLGEQTAATGGAALTARQVAKVRLLGPRDGVILAPDNDRAGLQSALDNWSKLRPLGVPTFCALPPRLPWRDGDGRERHSKDWNELVQHCGLTRAEARAGLERALFRLDFRGGFRLRQELARINPPRG